MKNQIQYLQDLFYDILNDFGRVYIIVKHSENSYVGKRGFTDAEKERGLVLVFNDRNYKSLVWDNNGSIQASLGFGADNKSEECFLHFDDLVTVFSPDCSVRFDRWDMLNSKKDETSSVNESKPSAKTDSDVKVISIKDFKKKKR